MLSKLHHIAHWLSMNHNVEEKAFKVCRICLLIMPLHGRIYCLTLAVRVSYSESQEFVYLESNKTSKRQKKWDVNTNPHLSRHLSRNEKACHIFFYFFNYVNTRQIGLCYMQAAEENVPRLFSKDNLHNLNLCWAISRLECCITESRISSAQCKFCSTFNM